MLITKFKEIFWLTYRNIFSIIAAIISFNNFWYIYNSLYSRSFYADEIQHTHIIWNTFNGQLIYKDFFEHHGPLYPFFSSFILKILKIQPGIDFLTALRMMSFISLCLMALVSFFIVKKITKSNTSSIFAICCFSMWGIVQAHGYEIRPDLVQNLIMLIGVFLFIVGYESSSKKSLLISGIFFGLMIGFNFKTIIVLMAMSIFILIEQFIYKNKNAIKSFLYLIAGASTVPISLVVFFWQSGALYELFFYNTLFNLSYMKYNVWGVAAAQRGTIEFFFNQNIVLTTLFLLAFITTDFNKWQNRLFICLSLVTIYGSFHGLYPYYAISYLPFFCYFLSIFINRFLIKAFYKKYSTALINLVILFFISLFLVPSFAYVFKKKEINPSKKYLQQKAELAWVIKTLARSEQVAIFRIGSVGSIFNQNHKYFWRTGVAESKAAKVNLDRDLMKTIEKEQVDFLFVIYRELRYKPQFFKKYLHKNFELKNLDSSVKNQSIWIRKSRAIKENLLEQK